MNREKSEEDSPIQDSGSLWQRHWFGVAVR
jgi:hypothetical protein